MDTNELGTLSATERPHHMVARAGILTAIHDAIFDEGEECRIVTIEGDGGLGKTRTLEEVLRRLGHKETVDLYGPLPESELWPTDTIAYCEPIDFTDTKIHTREFFTQAIGNSRNWHPIKAASFDTYAGLLRLWQRLINRGSAYAEIKGATEKALEAFWEDFKKAAAERRLVLLLDTTEQLAITSSEWLLDRGLIKPEETAFATPRWLLDAIKAGNFKNTTLIIAGRDREGARFFQALRNTVAEAGEGLVSHKPIKITPFSVEETRAYFQTLQREIQTDARAYDPAIQEVYERIVGDDDRLRVMHLYTGGQPVALAVYSDILIDGGIPPEPLQDTLAEAMERLGIAGPVDWQAMAEDDPRRRALDKAQREIGREFIRILFHDRPGLQGLILQALARCTRGLDAEQLHFLIYSQPNEDIAKWEQRKKGGTEPEELAEIRAVLNDMRRLAIVRAKPGKRFGLQDEVYRMYAELMAGESTLATEQKEREYLYRRLRDWAAFQAARLESEQRELVRNVVAGISLEVPGRATHVFIVELTPSEEKRRQELSAALRETELEHLHYSLALEPETQLNNLYYQIVVAARTSQRDEPRAAMFQAEMWRLMQNEYLLPFVKLSERDVVKERGESAVDVLRRAAQQDDAVQWILNLFNARQYNRAIELADAIEGAVADLSDGNEKHSWSHTLARANRACWREFARIYKAKSHDDLQHAFDIIKGFASDLEVLARTPMSEMAELPGRDEYGFKGHPAEERLKILLTQIYNNLGYGYVSLGQFDDAVEAYTHSLMGLREVAAKEIKQLQSITLNNLSRALAELGKIRAIEVCQDGLDLILGQGILGRVGYSFNTMALIWSDFRLPDQALANGQKALAIGKFVGDPRLRGLALLQIGEALRRIASSPTTSGAMVDSLFREAERALMEAKDIFIDGELRTERIRSIETYMELGSLYRDWTRYNTITYLEEPYVAEQRLRSANDFLKNALDESIERELFHLELDARINLAQANFYARQYKNAERDLDEALGRVEAKSIPQLRKNVAPPRRKEIPSYVLKQLSKLHSLRGQMAFERFMDQVESLKKEDSPGQPKKPRYNLDENSIVKELLATAAESYTLATAYAQLYSPGSELLALIYKDLYSSVKKLNVAEMTWFYQCERQARQDYKIGELDLVNEGDLEDFLKDCFGDFYDQHSNGELGIDAPAEVVTE